MKITINNVQDIFKSKQKNDRVIKSQGYELIEDLFCDNSCFGTEDEPALTYNGTISKVKEILENNPIVYTWITGVGQFQVFLSVYKKSSEANETKHKRLANNTYFIEENGIKRIILHDTVILQEENRHIKICTGGWNTMTTRRRINEYLPRGNRMYVKNFDQFVVAEGKTIPFVEGMQIIGLLNI